MPLMERFSHNTKGVQSLAENFIKNESYVFIHGCNSGFAMAPAFADLWALPVLASYTGTDFQQWSTQDYQWYFNNPESFQILLNGSFVRRPFASA